MMKKTCFLLFTVVVFTAAVYSQQLPLFSNYISNSFLYNPGVTGSLFHMPVSLNIRQQWSSIPDAPSTQVISIHSKIKRTQTGIGGYFFNDRFGPISQTGIQASYAYHLSITKDIKLGLGLSLSAFQFKINKYNLSAIDDNELEAILKNGGIEARKIASKKVAEVREKIGL